MNEYLFLTAEMVDLMTLLKTDDPERSFSKFNKASKHTKIEGSETEKFKIAKFKHKKIEVTFAMMNTKLQFSCSKLLNLIATHVLLECYERHERIEANVSIPLSEVKRNVNYLNKTKLNKMIEVMNSIVLFEYSRHGKALFNGRMSLLKCELMSDGLNVTLPNIQTDGFDFWKWLVFYFENFNEIAEVYNLNNSQTTLLQLASKYKRQTKKKKFTISKAVFLTCAGFQDSNERRMNRKIEVECETLNKLQFCYHFDSKNGKISVKILSNF